MNLWYKATCYHLLGTIIHEHLYEQAPQNIISAERISSVKNVLTFISDNYSNNISLDDLSALPA